MAINWQINGHTCGRLRFNIMPLATTVVQSMTKALTIVLAAAAVLAIEADRTPAEGAAWCLVGSGGSGRDCGFYTFEQCLASRAGGSSHCEEHCNYSGNPPDANRPTRRR